MSFLCEVKIEVTRGHEGQNFPKFPNYMTWLHIMRIISVPVTATSKFKKSNRKLLKRSFAKVPSDFT